jgi:hypothetical protein
MHISLILAVSFVALTTTFAQQRPAARVYTLADKPEASRRNVYEELRRQNEGDRGINTHVRVVQALGPGPQGAQSYVVAADGGKEPFKLELSPARPVFRVGASLAATIMRVPGSHDYASPDGRKLSLQTWREVGAADTARARWKSYEQFLSDLQSGARESLRRTEPTVCRDCHGKGVIIRGVTCRRCAGTGSILSASSYLVIWDRQVASRRR